jgi:hypothetical protein
VEVQVETGICKRVIHRLCLLERAPKDPSTTEDSHAVESSNKISDAHCHHLRVYYYSVHRN